MEKKYVMAIDQSTSSTKAIFFDKKGNLVHRVNADHKQYYPKLGWVEHDACEIFEKVCFAVKKLYEETGINPDEVAALGLSNQRETALVWDKKTGKPIYHAIVWQCQRAEAICKQIEQKGYGNLIKEKTGLVLSPYFPAAKIKWILDNVEGARRKAEAGELVCGTIDTWLLWNLTNGKVHATDYSNASRTQLFHIHEKKWDEEILNIFTIPKNMMADVCDSNALFGYTQKESVFGAEIPICGCMGDSHAALFGQTCFLEGMTKTTYGTGSSIMMNIGRKALASKNGLVTSIAWGIDGIVEYVFEGNINCTGDTLKWLTNELELIKGSFESENIAKTVENNGGVYIVPAFVGLNAPYWNSKARATISGLSRGATKAHVVRAALESIAYQIKDVVDIMVKESDVELKELRVDGGPTRNVLLMQFQADILNVAVVCCEIEELSAAGAAYMAGISFEFWNGKEELSKLRKETAYYMPSMKEQERKALYDGWKKAIQRTLL